MKGQLEVPIIGILIVITIIMGILVVGKFLTTPLVQLIKYQEEYENTQMIFISLLSSKENGKTLMELIGDNIVYGNPDDSQLKQILEKKLDKLIETKCYKISISSKILIKKECEPTKYEKTIPLPLPYNEGNLIEKITLVMN